MKRINDNFFYFDVGSNFRDMKNLPHNAVPFPGPKKSPHVLFTDQKNMPLIRPTTRSSFHVTKIRAIMWYFFSAMLTLIIRMNKTRTIDTKLND